MHRELLFFGRTFLAGVCLAAGYDILRIFRNIVPHNPFFSGAEDILYGCASGLFLFSVIYVGNDGEIRGYALLASCLGIVLYHWGPSGILVRGLTAFFEKTGKIVGILGKPLEKWRKRLKFSGIRVKIFLYEHRSIQRNRKRKNEEKKKRNLQNRIAMLSITFVVGILFVVMMTKSLTLEEQLAGYEAQMKELDSRIEEEHERTSEIEDMKAYMKTDEYAEEVARDKLGLVKNNEIVFKEKE